MAQRTTVKVTHETWRRLTDRKEPGTSYDDIISTLLDEVDAMEESPAEN